MTSNQEPDQVYFNSKNSACSSHRTFRPN